MACDLLAIQGQIDLNGHVKLEILDPKIRKCIHEYCDKQPNLTHISYYNKECEQSTKKTKYWCNQCRTWKLDESTETRTHYCCEDEYGGQGCPDFAIMCVTCDNVIWNQDANDDSDYKRKQIISNNAMLIFSGDVYAEKNKQLIKSIGMRQRSVNKKKKRFQNVLQ